MSDTDKKSFLNLSSRFSIFFKMIGLTQEEFSKRIGVARSQVSSWKSGVHSPSGTALKMMESEFNLNTSWLLTGEGEMLLSRKEVVRDSRTDDAFDFARRVVQNPKIKKFFERIMDLDKKSLDKLQAYLDGMEGK